MTCSRTFDNAEDAIAALDAGRPPAASSEASAGEEPDGPTGAAADPSPESVPDVLLLDVHLPGRTGIEALPRMRAASPQTAIVMLTIMEDDAFIFKAFQAGASGYLVKDAAIDDVLEAVRQAAAGGTLMPAPVAERVLAHFRAAPSGDYNLTPREREVLQLMTEGLSQRQIAERLFVSPHTVNTHVQHLYAKLQVNSGIEAVVKAVRERLV
jgi:two-component system NarL family response regulator